VSVYVYVCCERVFFVSESAMFIFLESNMKQEEFKKCIFGIKRGKKHTQFSDDFCFFFVYIFFCSSDMSFFCFCFFVVLIRNQNRESKFCFYVTTRKRYRWIGRENATVDCDIYGIVFRKGQRSGIYISYRFSLGKKIKKRKN